MRVIELNAASWNTTDDFYKALLVAVGAPEHHGRNLNALVDSMIWGGMNAVEPPYVVRISEAAKLPNAPRKEIEMAKNALVEARAEFRALRGRDRKVDIETDS